MQFLLVAPLLVFALAAYPVAVSQDTSGTFYSILEDGNTTNTFLEYAGRVWLNMTLKDPFENLTVFAPSDDAFMALPSDVQQKLENDLDLLTKVMTFHFYQGMVALDVDNALYLSLNGMKSRVNVYKLHNTTLSTVLGVPVPAQHPHRARNGVLYVVDRVLFPTPTSTALDFVNRNNFNMLMLALTKAGASSLFKAPDVTILAPTDAAFQMLPVGYFSKMLQDLTLLTEVLENHAVKGVWYSAYFLANGGGVIETVAGKKLNVTVTAQSSTLHISQAEVTQADVSVTNGVVYVINQVLIPQPPPEDFVPEFIVV